MGKGEMTFFFRLNGDIWIFLQKYLLSSPMCFILILSKFMNLIDFQGDIKRKFLIDIQNLDLLFKIPRGMKLILCIHDIDITLYINSVLIQLFENCVNVTLVAMAV